MKNIKILLAIVVLVSFAALPAFAQSSGLENRPCDDLFAFNETAVAKAQLVRLLRERNFKEIEDEIESRYQRAVGTGTRELPVYGLLSFIDSGDPEFEPRLNEWVRVSSKSVWPLVVRAKYWKAVGWKKRGNKFADETTSDQFESFGAELEKAVVDLNQALKIDPNNVMVYASYFGVSNSSAGTRTAAELVTVANKVAPKNFVVRFTAIYFLSPRWNGSFEAMDKIVDGAKLARMSEDDVMRLRYAVEREKGSHFSAVEKDYSTAISSYERAIKICDGRGAWNDIVKINFKRKDWPALEVTATQLIRVWPEYVNAYERRGFAREQLGRTREAIPDYERAASRGSSWAQQKLAMQYIEGKNVPADLQKARGLLELAAAKGEKGARENLEKLEKWHAKK